MNKSTLFISFVISLVIGNLNFLVSQNSYFWYYYTIEDSIGIKAVTDLIFSGNGLPNLAYRDGGNVIKFASYDGIKWNIQIADNTSFLGGGRVTMILDSLDRPHVLYHANDGANIKYAFYNGTVWISKEIESGLVPTSYYWISSSYNSAGRIHFCYTLSYPNELLTYNYIENDTTGGSALVDGTGINGKWSSLALDASEIPSIAYYSDGFADLKFAYMNQGVWLNETIEESSGSVSQGFFPSMTLGPDGQFYIAFQEHSIGKIKLARGNFGSWIVEDVVNLTGWTTFSTPNPLSVNQQGEPHIAYCDAQNADLMLAYKSQNIWHIENIDTSGEVGQFASMAINPITGLPSVSYFNESHRLLRIAIASLTAPVDTDGDGLPDYLEIIHGTDPADLDSDDDGLTDGEEDRNHNGLVESYETDPRLWDSDGDGLSDGLESGRTNGIAPKPGIKGTDPLKFVPDLDPSTTTDPRKFDTDGDEMGDGEEDINHNGREDFDETDPNNPDTDGDGILDGYEIQLGTDPLDVDSDDDGLADGTEDVNLNGIGDTGETSPSLFDTDGDSLSDGLELGITNGIPDPDGSGKLKGTDLNIFVPDSDPSTTTDPSSPDTDNDYLVDGLEDINHNGNREPEESDPLNPDSDGDGLLDGYDVRLGASAMDVDSDDDGLADGIEDANRNGVLDAGETSPGLFDTDGDSLSDGLESGITNGVPDPDGSGPIKGTDMSIFIPDSDPSVNSEPLLWDTDGDYLSDGDEDSNRNGAVDQGETHFLMFDTDNDGWSDGDEVSFLSDPLNNRSVLQLDTVLQESFDGSDIPAGWQVVDEGTIDAPSYWFIWDNSLTQGTNIHGGSVTTGGEDPYKPGTYIWASHFTGADYKLSYKMSSQSNGSMGIMFYYKDNSNYYRFSMNREKSFQRLTKIVQGKWSIVSNDSFTYETNKEYKLTLYCIDGRIQVYLDGIRIFIIDDHSIINSSLGFYCWKNAMTRFDDLEIISGNSVTGIIKTGTKLIKDFYYFNRHDRNILEWNIFYANNIERLELNRIDINGMNITLLTQFVRANEFIISGKYSDDDIWNSKNYKLIIYDHNGDILEQSIANVRKGISYNIFLSEPYPNPSNNMSEIRIINTINVKISYNIYNVLGQKVYQDLFNFQPGLQKINWDGTDELGILLPSGIYYLKFDILDESVPRKILRTEIRKILRIH
ncbi:MAG: T9SS type A sorting domain-containing protein [Calditrichaeota bacterium]|nr:T9SS type A sorting domain-containing protein [Calditrichota bacterium]